MKIEKVPVGIGVMIVVTQTWMVYVKVVIKEGDHHEVGKECCGSAGKKHWVF